MKVTSREEPSARLKITKLNNNNNKGSDLIPEGRQEIDIQDLEISDCLELTNGLKVDYFTQPSFRRIYFGECKSISVIKVFNNVCN
jgi:hypothetical protein